MNQAATFKATKGQDFAHLLRVEWVNFRTGGGYVKGILAAALAFALLGLLYAALFRTSCDGPNGSACPIDPIGPDGKAVHDRFYFVHQPLDGDGSITVRLASMTGVITYPPPNHDEIVAGVAPWAGLAVLCVYTALAFGLAVLLQGKRQVVGEVVSLAP